jgi:hypothetical protein
MTRSAPARSEPTRPSWKYPTPRPNERGEARRSMTASFRTLDSRSDMQTVRLRCARDSCRRDVAQTLGRIPAVGGLGGAHMHREAPIHHTLRNALRAVVSIAMIWL